MATGRVRGGSVAVVAVVVVAAAAAAAAAVAAVTSRVGGSEGRAQSLKWQKSHKIVM